MEVVHDFNSELSSLYEVKPPISKAKMMQITKSAIKGIKFYKHIVQSVEKFIQKCKPEYKVPGLYVIDSIVRQSRHQFGAEKEVFAPRFMKNIMSTFQCLFRCADDDRPKIVRVLNLWQKNTVFPIDVIQPLLDMANPNSAGEYASFDNPPPPTNESPARKAPPPVVNETPPNSKHKSSESWKGWPQGQEEVPTDTHSYSEMSTKNLEKFTKANSGIVETIAPPPTTKSSEMKIQDENAVKFNKKLLDFDYGDEEDEEELKGEDGQTSLAYSISQSLLSNPELLCHLQQMQQSIQQNESLKSELNMQSQPVVQPKENREIYSPAVPENKIPTSIFLDTQPPLPQQPNMMYTYDSNTMGYPPLPPHMPMLPQEQKLPMDVNYSMLTQENLMIQSSQVDEDDRMIYSMPGEPPLPPQDLDERSLVIPGDERIKKERSRSRSGSRGRGSMPLADLDERTLILPGDTRVKKRRSRSRSGSRGPGRSGRHRSRSRSPRRRKSRSRSRSRSRRNRSRSKDRDRERRKEREREKERERDRQKKGIPPVRKNAVSVCSTTLWLGHVPKTLSEADIASTYADFGVISSIDMIPPRGCAYVVMDRRQDAHRALQKLRNLKLQGSSIKMAWAPGKGTKGKEYKDYWEMESGVTYIPFEKLSNNLAALDALEEGGFIDEESLPPHLREMRQQCDATKHGGNESHQTPPAVGEKHGDKNGIVSQPATLQATMLPPNLGSLPMVLPQMMQPQFGMPLPGLMPPQPMVVQHMPMPVGVPPPNPLMIVQPPSQNLLAGTPLPVGAVPQMPQFSMHPSLSTVTLSMSHMASAAAANVNSKPAKETLTAGDATPTDEDGTRVSTPPSTLQMTTSASVTPVVSQSGIAQFNSTIGLHGASRHLLPGVPTSTTNSLPFPPPHLRFGFPPPTLRHGAPPPNMPVVSLSSAYQWPKQPAPNFGGFSEADVRYSAPAGVLPGNIRPLSHQPGKMNVPISTQSPMPNRPAQSSGESASTSKESTNQTGVNDKDRGRRAENVNSEGFNARSNVPSKTFNRPLTPQTYDMEIDHEDPRDMFPGNREDFPRDHRGAIPPHFHGHPPDFPPPPHGGMRDRWMPSNVPGPRFPRGGILAFPPRGPRGVFPRMDMDYFPPQGPPPGPRMHGLGPRGFPPRRGGGNFPPPPSRDRFPSRGDFYNEPPPHFEDGERSRGHGAREDWNQHRREWEEPKRHAEDEESRKPPTHQEKEKVEQKDQPKPEESPTKTTTANESLPKAIKPETPIQTEVKLGESVPVEMPKVKPKAKQKNTGQDLFNDMFRLQNYGQRSRKGPVKSFCANKAVKKVKPAVTKENASKEDNPVSVNEKKEETELKPETTQVTLKLNSSDVQSSVTNSAEPNTLNESVQEKEKETSNKRERDRKRSSRWGRTLSEEREFQQKKMSEASVNGSVETNDSRVETVPVVSNIESSNERECTLPPPPAATKCSIDVTDPVMETDNATAVSADVIQPLASQEPTCVTTNSTSVEAVETAVTTGPVDSTVSVAL